MATISAGIEVDGYVMNILNHDLAYIDIKAADPSLYESWREGKVPDADVAERFRSLASE